MKRRSLVVVSGGVSRPSSTRLLADQLAEATRGELAGLGVEADVTVIELRDLAHDVVNHTLTGFPAAALKQALDAVAAADGLIAVTPTFNASYAGLFKSFFDVVDASVLIDKPVLIGATGGSARHSLVLEHAVRPMFAYLRAATVGTSVYAASEDWGGGGGESMLRRRVTRAGRELAEAMGRNEPVTVEDPFALTSSFEQMLAQGE